MAQPNLKEREPLVLTRNFPVAPDKVWRAWIDPAAIRVWFGQADAPGWSMRESATLGEPISSGWNFYSRRNETWPTLMDS